MKNLVWDFIKYVLLGIIVGVGGIAPGLSGSVLLVILGLYERCISTISTLFQDFKKNILFLLPLVMGFAIGILLFSKAVDWLLLHYEMPTRFAFLGLVLGTLPMFYREVKKKGYAKRYYIVILAAAALGFALFSVNKSLFPQISQPNLVQSALLGVAVAGSSIVPGVDSAVILSSLGLYDLYVHSLAHLNMEVLLPAGAGLIVGAVVISLVMNFLLKRFYTFTFSAIFGLFLSIIPNVLGEHCVLGWNWTTALSFLVLLLGLCLSLYLGDIPGNHARLKKLLHK